MNDENLEQIKRRVLEATKGEWKASLEGKEFTSGSSFIMVVDDGNRRPDIELIGATDADIIFVANAKQDIPLLLEEIDRLKKIIERLKK